MPNYPTDIFNVGTTAKRIDASADNQKRIVAASAAIFYKNESDVDTEDTEVEKGANVETEETLWIVCATEAVVFVESLPAPTYQDITVADDLTLSGELLGGPTVGATGVAPISAPSHIWAGEWAPNAVTVGTDVSFAEKKLFVTSIWVPCNMTLTGVFYLVGETGGTNKAVAGLFNSAGEVLAKSSETTEGTVVGTADQIQKLAFTSTYAAKGPARYFIGVTANGGTAEFHAIPAQTSLAFTDEIELEAKNVLEDVEAPSTFTADQGVVGGVY